MYIRNFSFWGLSPLVIALPASHKFPRNASKFLCCFGCVSRWSNKGTAVWS